MTHSYTVFTGEVSNYLLKQHNLNIDDKLNLLLAEKILLNSQSPRKLQ